MERSFASILFLTAAICVALAAGAWWMQRIVFTPEPTRSSADAILDSPDIRLTINNQVTSATAPILGRDITELAAFVERDVLSTRAGAAMMAPITEQAHERILGQRTTPLRLSGPEMAEIVRDQRVADAEPVTIPVDRIAVIANFNAAIGWIVPIAGGLGLMLYAIGLVLRPDARDIRTAIGEQLIALGVAMAVFGYLIPVHFITAIDDRTFSHAIPGLALRTLPVVVITTMLCLLLGAVLLLTRRTDTRRSQPLSTSRYSGGWT